MKISVFGTGYVGLVTGVCLAEVGNNVRCVEIDHAKIKVLKDGISPIYEPGLTELLKNNIAKGRIHFTDDAKEAIEKSDYVMIAVGTPSNEDGSANLNWVRDVAKTIGTHMNDDKIVMLKSTVPVGTNHEVKKIIQNELKQRKVNFSFEMVSNPEFLREGNAVTDCLHPDRVIVGCESDYAREQMNHLFQTFVEDKNQIVFMDLTSSELTKYAANAFLATRISFMNEMSALCERVGANINDIKRGMALDHRIGPHHLNAGIGYGGSCFPKDVKALIHTAHMHQTEAPILKAVHQVNSNQRQRFIKLILSKLKPNSTVALWGIAFKPGTNDIREAPALDIAKALLENGHRVRAFDPVASDHAKAHFHDWNSQLAPSVKFHDEQYECLDQSHYLVIATEWELFREPDFEVMQTKISEKQIFDCRNIYDLERMQSLGFKYFSIGRRYLE